MNFKVSTNHTPSPITKYFQRSVLIFGTDLFSMQNLQRNAIFKPNLTILLFRSLGEMPKNVDKSRNFVICSDILQSRLYSKGIKNLAQNCNFRGEFYRKRILLCSKVSEKHI